VPRPSITPTRRGGSAPGQLREPYTTPPVRLPNERHVSSAPPADAEPRSSANAGTATRTTPIPAPNATRAPQMVRIPGATSGPSHPTSCRTPRQRRDAGVSVNAIAALVPSVAATTTATVGDVTATSTATSAGALTIAISNAIATIA